MGLNIPRDTTEIFLSALPQLRDLSALSEVRTVSYLDLVELNVDALAELANLISIGSAKIMSNPRLRDLDGLGNLRQLGAAEISYNPQLSNMDALSVLETLGSVSFVDDDALGHLPTFENVSKLGSLQIAENASLETGPYFPSVTEGSFTISDNPKLLAVDGFQALVRSYGGMSVSGNASVTRVDLGALQSAEYLTVTNNAALGQLDLSRLQSVDGLDVGNNPNLGGTGLHVHPSLAGRFGVSASPASP
jgi:hypothetical protein